jgi:hypothetical protein
LLLLLNPHFEGHAHADALSPTGKTDLLIRLSDCNLFVGEV